jgi:hypothetical protein
MHSDGLTYAERLQSVLETFKYTSSSSLEPHVITEVGVSRLTYASKQINQGKLKQEVDRSQKKSRMLSPSQPTSSPSLSDHYLDDDSQIQFRAEYRISTDIRYS